MSESGLSVQGTGLKKPSTLTSKRTDRSKRLDTAHVALPLVDASLALGVLEEKLSSRFKSVREAFLFCDYDLDGKISSHEFRVVLDLMGLVMDDTEWSKLWAYFDTSGDGKIDYTEFNNKIGVLIHPPITRPLINRPQTPRVRQGNAHRLAMGIQKQMANLEEAFQMIDMDGSGVISHAEFIQALRHVGLSKVSDEESYQMIERFKGDDDGYEGLNFDQFKTAMADYLKVDEVNAKAAKTSKYDYVPVQKLCHAEKLLAEKLWGKFSAVQRAFRLFDDDKSGDLSYGEFRAALGSLGVALSDPDFRELVSKYDTNGDGVISYDEFNTQVGSLIHPDTINHRMKKMMDEGGAQESALHFDPHKKIGRHKPSAEELEARTMTGRARLMAPRLGLNEGEALFVHQLYGRFGDVMGAFREYDVDNSGELSQEELKTMLDSLGVRMTPDGMRMLTSKYDRNGDGNISYDELNGTLGPLMQENEGNSELLGISRDVAQARRQEAAERAAAHAESKEAGGGEVDIPRLPLGSSSSLGGGSVNLSQLSFGGGDGGSVGSARSVATRDLDLTATEDKMRKILGRSWLKVYKDMRKKQAAGGAAETAGMSSDKFRDAMAEGGVPLTAKEVRALSLRYQTPRGASRGSVDVTKLMQGTFQRRGTASRGSAATGGSLRGASRGGSHRPSERSVLSGAESARLSSRRSGSRR